MTLLELYDRELREAVPSPGVGYRIERDATFVRIIGPTSGAHDNTVILTRLGAASADAAIEAEIARFEALGHDFEWKVHAHDEPADLKARLIARGFVEEPLETVMAFDLQAPLHALGDPPAIRIEHVADPAQLHDVVAVQDAVWGEAHDWLGPSLAQEMRDGPDAIAVHVAYAQMRPVATAWVRFHAGTSFASTWGGATLPAWRGRGIYSALIAVEVEAARRRGYRYMSVDARETSRPIFEKLGFQTLARITACTWQAPR